MEYSVNAGFFIRVLQMPSEKIFPILAKNGFQALDFTPLSREEDWREFACRQKEICDANGLRVNQTHAPFNHHNAWGTEHAKFLERAFEVTKILKARYMVVHGDEFDFDRLTYSAKQAADYNYELFAPYVERAAKENIKLAFENLFPDADPSTPRFCSRLEELLELLNRFPAENVCCCWDFGHGQIAFGAGQAQQMRMVGSRIECTHIHDNYYGKDLHLPPFMGEVDWTACRQVMRDIGYQGVLSLELVHGQLPETLVPSYVAFLRDSLSHFENL